MSDDPAGWLPDPTGQHDHRYWDGTRWTDHVSDAGVAGTDPFLQPEPAAPPEAPVPGDEPTVLDAPAVAADTTSTWPAAPAPPEPYQPPDPSAGGGGRRGLLIGGGILVALAVAVVAFLALRSDDDEDAILGGDASDQTSDTTTDGNDGGSQGSEDPELLALRDDCEGGDLAACDELYFRSEIGSDLEEFGSTCGDTAEPQEGRCELSNGGQEDVGETDSLGSGLRPEDIEGMTEFWEQTLGITPEQADCLAEQLQQAVEDGATSEEQAFTDVEDFFASCDIDLAELGGG